MRMAGRRTGVRPRMDGRAGALSLLRARGRCVVRGARERMAGGLARMSEYGWPGGRAGVRGRQVKRSGEAARGRTVCGEAGGRAHERMTGGRLLERRRWSSITERKC